MVRGASGRATGDPGTRATPGQVRICVHHRRPPPARGDTTGGVWSDGVHLTELGDIVLLQHTERLLAKHRVVEKLLDCPLLERDRALSVAYRPTAS
jgi:hypothetical protein